MADTGRDLQTRELMDAMKELRLTIESLRKELSARDKLIENLQEQIAYLQKKLFGTSSEKRSIVVEGQLGLFDEVEMEAAKETDPEPDTEEETVVFTAAKTRKARTPKEELLKGVPMTEMIIELPDSERFCQVCGTEMKPAGKKFIRDEWNFVPAKLTVTRIYAMTYYCPECKKESGQKDSNTGNRGRPNNCVNLQVGVK